VTIGLAVTLYSQQYLLYRRPPQVKLEEPTFREKVEEVSFWLGGMGSGFTIADLEKKAQSPFNLSGFHPFHVYVENGKLFADVKVYGGANLPPIEVLHNEFVVRPPDWDRNSNSTAMEVVNERRFPVFQLIYETPSRIRVNGIFPFPGGLILATGDRSEVYMGKIPPISFPLKRIFRYPSWKYPGQYETP
jgi:hypothetical protein